MQKTLIIKLGAFGDVLRTTTILPVLEGPVTWITSIEAAPLLAANPLIQRLGYIEQLDPTLLGENFELVVNLEDGLEAARLASNVKAGTRVGPYLGNDGITYGESCREWFDMSLSSRFGKEQADRLKMGNRKTYQEMLFAMLGRRFEGQEYILKTSPAVSAVPGLVGLECRAGDVWPMKRWNKFDELARELEAGGFPLKFFEQRPTLEQYIEDIQQCEYVVAGDTLAMHLGLALRKKVVAIFTCTSPQEIHDYGRLTKIVSPLWRKYFYWRKYVPAAADAIPLGEVLGAVMAWAGRQAAAANPALR